MTKLLDELAQEIRRVDGDHKLGARALAEALMPFIDTLLRERESAVPVAWMTHHDAPMLFPTERECAEYCADDERPIPLYAHPQCESAKAAVTPSYWAAISDDGEIVVAYPADDGNKGEAARTECNQYINDALLNDRAALRLIPLYEAVAPMLASTEGIQEPYCYTVEQKNGLSQGAMCRTKAECEASPLFDPENEHVIPLYREPVLASADVPTELDSLRLELIEATEERDHLRKMLASARVPDGWQLVPVQSTKAMHDAFIAVRIEAHRLCQPPLIPHLWQAMLAAAPKPETEE